MPVEAEYRVFKLLLVNGRYGAHIAFFLRRQIDQAQVHNRCTVVIIAALIGDKVLSPGLYARVSAALNLFAEHFEVRAVIAGLNITGYVPAIDRNGSYNMNAVAVPIGMSATATPHGQPVRLRGMVYFAAVRFECEHHGVSRIRHAWVHVS